MITITNVTPPRELSSEWHTYQIIAARQVLANFQHRPADGIAKCLKRAANAMAIVNQLAEACRFLDEKIQNPKEVPDETDGLRCEEVFDLKAKADEADLEEKDCVVERILRSEESVGADTLVLAMSLGDHDRRHRELASSLREENASNLVADHSGVRPLP